MSLHDKIMRLPVPPSHGKATSRGSYIVGAVEMRDAAAEIAVKADAVIAQLVEALEHCVDWLDAAGIAATMPVQQQARAALAAKEQA